jgi:hypothetical protein
MSSSRGRPLKPEKKLVVSVIEIKLRSEATSIFDVQRWMFDLPAMP